VARHLVMTGRLLDEDPEAAWQHALAARARGARIGAVREATGLAAYRTGRYAQALAELRTLRRLTGSSDHLPIMADCERGLGRPERALALAASAEAGRLATPERVELLIVASGARADLGQHDAAVLALQVPELESAAAEDWVSRLRVAYANALAAVGRDEEAAAWSERAGVIEDQDQDEDDEIVDMGDLEGVDLGDLELGIAEVVRPEHGTGEPSEPSEPEHADADLGEPEA
jgi:tetratricopeptide (TPR) repeat protein